MSSVWSYESKPVKFRKLKNDIDTDILIIGGGIAGILCAYFLQQKNADYVLVEADRICKGITANTTAKITYQHGLIFDDMINRFGKEFAKKYIKANKYALEQYKSLADKIDCDFEVKDNYIYSVFNKEKIYNEVKALNSIGENARLCKTSELPFSADAVKTENQAQFNPLKLLYGISKDLNIYEYTKVRELIGTKVITDKAVINARKIIVATHFPFVNKHGFYFFKMYQHRSYVIALKNSENLQGMYVDENKRGLSFRTYKDLLLIGGEGNKTGQRCAGWSELISIAEKYYPNSEIKYKWATQDCMTLDDIPYIGQYSENTPNMFVITGFNKWGMTSAMAGAELLSDLVLERENEFENIFSPSRSIIRKQLFINGFNAVKNIVIPGGKRCPHMGCKLKWNKGEKTWDCPCHGSRFSKYGTLLDNPSTGDLK